MTQTFFFYDLETTGVNPRSARIMQFAGQRTTLDLEPIGEPVNLLIRLTPDVLPEPDAIMLTGITPQQTLADGLTEAEFLRFFYDEVVKPGTIFTGFNSIRFDDEFMRFLHYRNFYDAYGWQWQDGCSRWDILDMVRMTRALRPDGIEWPFASDGKPSNRLELLTSVNKLSHDAAHDALSDVYATIAVAKLIKDKQPELFDYVLSKRSKQSVATIVESGAPFVYTSGHYPSETWHTTAVTLLAKQQDKKDEALVFDLRYNPMQFIDLSVEEIAAAWRYNRDPDALRIPVKTIKYNRCPAIAPMGVIKDEATQDRIQLTLQTIEANRAIFVQHQQAFAEKMLRVVEMLDAKRTKEQAALLQDDVTVDQQLYDGFIGTDDQQKARELRNASASEISDFVDAFTDKRYNTLVPLYKARNFPKQLTGEERQWWEAYIARKLGGSERGSFSAYFARLEELAATKLPDSKRYLLEELQLYGQSLLP